MLAWSGSLQALKLRQRLGSSELASGLLTHVPVCVYETLNGIAVKRLIGNDLTMPALWQSDAVRLGSKAHKSASVKSLRASALPQIVDLER